MATIARMMVELAGDASRLRSMFRDSIREASTFGAQMHAAVNAQPLISTAAAARSGTAAGNELVRSLTRTYDAQMAATREARARGIIGENEARVAGERAAVEFNRTLLQGINALRNNRMLSQATHNRLVEELKDAGMEAGREARQQLEQQLRQLGGSLQSAGANLRQSGRMLTQDVTLPLLAIGGASVKAASDAAESANKFEVIFGRMAGAVNAQLQELHRTIPLTLSVLQDQAANFQALLVPMGFVPGKAAQMSVALTKLGGDIVSLNNTAQRETLERVFSGLVGEAESVRRFGVDISEARLKVLAHNKGLGDNVAALDRATKTQLIYDEIMRATSLAQGDAARTVDSASNSFRFLARDAQEAAQTLGRQLLPTVVPLVQSLSRVFQVVQGLSPQTLDMAIRFALLAAAIGPVLLVVGTLVTAIGTMITAWATLGPVVAGAIVLLTGPAGWVLAVGAAVAALAGWIAMSSRAKQSNEQLADSYKFLNEAQLSQQMQENVTKELALMKERERLMRTVKPGDIAPPTAFGPGAVGIGQRVNPDVGRLNEVNRELDATRDKLNGLGTAWNRLGAQQDTQRREQQRIFQANDAAYAAILAGMNNSLGASKAAAAAAKAQAKAEREAMQELAGSVSSLTDLHEVGVKFHQDVRGIDAEAVRTFNSIQKQLDATGGRFDATTAKLLNMKDQLLKIGAVAEAEARRQRELAIAIGRTAQELGGLIRTTPNAAQIQEAARPKGGPTQVPDLQPITRAPGTPGTGVNVPGVGPGVVMAPPPALNEWAGRANDALDLFGKGLHAAADSVRQQLLPLSDAARGLINPIYFFGSVLGEIAGALRPVFEPLRPVLKAVADIVAKALVPVFQALAPALEAFLPLLQAVMQVLAPILAALAPLFRALAAILEPLFPIFKLLGIAATYIGQAFGIAANIVLRAVGNIIIGFGKIIEVLARAVDKLPFVSAKGAINAAIAVQNFGRGLLTAADEMKNMANDMAHAREEIRGVGVTSVNAVDGVEELGNAASETAAALLFVPTIFRLQMRVAEQLAAESIRRPITPSTPTVPTQPAAPPQLTVNAGANAQADARQLPPPAAPAQPIAPPQLAGMHVEQLIIQNPASGEDVVEEIDAAYRRLSMATFGTTQRVSELP